MRVSNTLERVHNCDINGDLSKAIEADLEL